jgi:septum formation protein
VLAADTSVVLGSEILGKPADAQDALRMLRRLSGRSHRVLTGVAVGGRANADCVVDTEVHFRDASDEELSWYVRTGEPTDKAGAYAIQGAGGFLVRRIAGSYSNVVGLPLVETLALLAQAGYPLPWSGK